jgi:hypothetical protein
MEMYNLTTDISGKCYILVLLTQLHTTFDSFFSACNHLHSVSIYYDVSQSRRQEFLENNTISLSGCFHLWNVEVYEKNICLPIRS